MYSEAKKLHLIGEILKVKNDAMWIALENVLKKNTQKKQSKGTSIYDFVGFLSEKEATEMKDAIAETCETIDENDWK